MRLMGLDVGDRTIGVAVSDENGVVALPRETLRRERLEKDLARLMAIVTEDGVGRIVVGLPFSLDGSEGPQAAKVRAFIAALSERTSVPVTAWDERLSTVAAERSLIEADLSRARRRLVIDQVAATLILQTYLDYRRSLEAREEIPTDAS